MKISEAFKANLEILKVELVENVDLRERGLDHRLGVRLLVLAQ